MKNELSSKFIILNSIYTFSYISPYGMLPKPGEYNNLPKLRWIANITLPECINPEALCADFLAATVTEWELLGKRNSRFSFELLPGHAEAAVPSNPDLLIQEGGKWVAVISLQTDALLFDVLTEMNHASLDQVYDSYWQYATNNTCKLQRFYALQTFYGGYFGRMYPLHADNKYYPYLMTQAGSTFVLEAISGKEDECRAALAYLQENGLPLPQELIVKLQKAGVSENRYWRQCPFVPQNGFGEIAINLDWHWQKRFVQP